MRPSWWMLVMALGVAGGLLVHHRIKTLKERSTQDTEEWPLDKNFGAFPPEIPDEIFDGLTQI